MSEKKEKASDLFRQLEEIEVFFDLDNKQLELERINTEVSQPATWSDQKKFQSLQQRKKLLEKEVNFYKKLHDQKEEIEVLLELAEEGQEILGELNEALNLFEQELQAAQLRTLFFDPDDARSAILTIHPGAGGTESQDWAQMLFRMYLRYAERKGFKTEVVDFQPGEEAGLKSATIRVEGDYAYGLLSQESGVHRLVRISPFDANKRRHTSFAAVFVYPEIEDDVEVEINPDDLKIDTYRSSGKGGQHVNRTDSAVRITHLPTGIVVQCQNERSQHQNKATALRLLKARLYEIEKQKKQEKLDKLEDSKSDIAWGSQIRSYVLHPYKMIKDLRTRLETGDVDRILDGDLDDFIKASLTLRKKEVLAANNSK
ncbi:MAG: peptide chain release factor 2 [Candidatus Aminicenantales bacterium]